MGHLVLDGVRELVSAQGAYVQLLEQVRTLVNSPVLDCSLASQQALRRSFCVELAVHLPSEPSSNGIQTPSSSDDDGGRYSLAAAAEHLRLTARTKLSRGESAAVRAELHRHDEHLLERYRKLSEQVQEPILVGILNRQHTVIQEWTQRLGSKKHA